ncbi:MAG: hypothetical protein KIT72_02430 [Polyangiaceae bacterium]|nr:hypothetical protein [Polyangiaceae bacterium]MCW5789255.1 hypothetical protein [Polyangiaceae bacterium]
MRAVQLGWLVGVWALGACGPGASGWAEPLIAPEDEWRNTPAFLAARGRAPGGAEASSEAPRAQGDDVAPESSSGVAEPDESMRPGEVTEGVERAPEVSRDAAPLPSGAAGGRALGRFKNTYYDFPHQAALPGGGAVPLHDASCREVAEVPGEFYQRLCVQGSGLLSSGETVSFAKRGCACATRCEKTGQQLCFDKLDAARFPWGRGALGKPINALRSLAVDPSEVPLGSLVYLPEFDGLTLPGGAVHDGCFVAEDRGLWVKGRHVDVFAGTESMRLALERQIPTGRGVHVVLGADRCRAAAK